MENKVERIQAKTTKSKDKSAAKHVSIRVRNSSKKLAAALLEKANDKKFGRKIKLDELFELAVSLVTSDHINLLQGHSMTNEDRKEVLRQKYIEMHGAVTRDEFIGLMMKPEFFDFLKEHGKEFLAS